jgi:hypothetical protein
MTKNFLIPILFLQSIAIHASNEQSNQQINLAENKRIEASICMDSMNRISVANDRITQIFGDEGTFESQNDEATGQIFLKPTAVNGSKNLSLTLITEQGITQDLTLIPTSKSPQTLILIRETNSSVPKNAKNIEQQTEPNLNFATTLPAQEQLLKILKQAIHNQLPTFDEEISHRQLSNDSISLTSTQSWKAGPYIVDALIVENTSEKPLELQEKDFYQAGDLAISFYNKETHKPTTLPKVLNGDDKTTLYVVRYLGAHQS